MSGSVSARSRSPPGATLALRSIGSYTQSISLAIAATRRSASAWSSGSLWPRSSVQAAATKRTPTSATRRVIHLGCFITRLLRLRARYLSVAGSASVTGSAPGATSRSRTPAAAELRSYFSTVFSASVVSLSISMMVLAISGRASRR